MVELASLVSEFWLILLISLIVSALAFPIVFVFSFVYESLADKYRRTPRILLMALCTFLAVFAVFVVLELYVGITLAQVAGALASKG